MRMNRRTVLKAGIAGLIGTPLAWGAAPESDKFRGLKVGVHSYSLRKFKFAEAIKIIQDLGVKYLTLNPIHLPLDSSSAALADAKKAISDAGLTLMGVGVVSFKKGDLDPRQIFDYARTLGLPTIIANPSHDDLDMLDKFVAEYNIRIAIHNHGPDTSYSLPEDVLKAVENHHKNIGACCDIGHYERSGVKAETALKTLSARLYDVHLKDVNAREKAGHGVVLGQGVIDFASVAKTLLALKYEGQVGLEYEIEPESPQASMAKCFAYFADSLAKVG